MPSEGLLAPHADGQGLAALPGDLEDLLDAVSGVARGGSSLSLAILLVPASTNTPLEATGPWAPAPESPPSAALLAASRPGSRRMAESRHR